MSVFTTVMGLGKAVGSDLVGTYLKTTLAAALDKLDAHRHDGGSDGNAVKALQTTDTPAAAGQVQIVPNQSTLRWHDGALRELALSRLAHQNLLTNGGLEIWQRGAGPFTAHGAYTADRWVLYLGGGSTASVSKVATDHGYGAQIQYGHVPGGSCLLSQKLEDATQLRGRTLALSVRIQANVANTVWIRIFDSDGVNGESGASGRHPGDGSWQVLTATKLIQPDATVVAAEVILDAGGSGTATVDDAMLVIDSVPHDYLPLAPAEEWQRCLRYYEIHGPDSNWPLWRGYGTAGMNPAFAVPFNARKAVIPTLTRNGTWAVTNCAQPGVARPATMGYVIFTSVTSTGTFDFAPDSADDTITAEANP